jgi:hypothetical protein
MKFSIRDLILVTVIVAVCLAWWLDRSKLANAPKPAPPPIAKPIAAPRIVPTPYQATMERAREILDEENAAKRRSAMPKP